MNHENLRSRAVAAAVATFWLTGCVVGVAPPPRDPGETIPGDRALAPGEIASPVVPLEPVAAKDPAAGRSVP